MIIGMTGQKRSGKDTFATSVIKEFRNLEFNRISFAQPMKEIAKIMFSLNDEELEEQKESFELDGITPRKFLQLFGTEFCRKLFKDDIWVRKCLTNIVDDKVNIITDVRFDNEAIQIKNLGGVIVKVIRGEEKPAEHVSEMGVSSQFIDLTLLNNDSKAEFEQEAIYLFNFILGKYNEA